MNVYMQEQELSLNEKKTMLVSVSSGVDFLGYHLDQGCITDYDSPFVRELLSGYEKLVIYEETDILTELMQDYTELHCLNKVSRLMERYQKQQDAGNRLLSAQYLQNQKVKKNQFWMAGRFICFTNCL